MNDLGTLTEAEKREIFPELYHGPERLEGVEGSERPLVAATRSGDEPMAAETAKRESPAVAPGEVAEAIAVAIEELSRLATALAELADEEGDYWTEDEIASVRSESELMAKSAKALQSLLPRPDSEASFSELRGRRNDRTLATQPAKKDSDSK